MRNWKRAWALALTAALCLGLLGGCGLTDAFVFGHAAAESIMGLTTYTDV